MNGVSYLTMFLDPVKPWLDDPAVSEIMINGPKEIYIEKSGRLVKVDSAFPSEAALFAAANNIAKSVGRLLNEEYPRLRVENMGETDIIVTYEDQKTSPKAWHILKTAFVAAVTFFGAAFSIMAFNNDVDVTKLFGQIYELVTGQETGGFTILEITYSIGITAGILIFFNHFGKKRFTVDPTPMEVQMRLYENEIQTTLAEDAARKGAELDAGTVGTADPSGSSRT